MKSPLLSIALLYIYIMSPLSFTFSLSGILKRSDLLQNTGKSVSHLNIISMNYKYNFHEPLTFTYVCSFILVDDSIYVNHATKSSCDFKILLCADLSLLCTCYKLLFLT